MEVAGDPGALEDGVVPAFCMTDVYYKRSLDPLGLLDPRDSAFHAGEEILH